jgi:hypothetical protein
VGRGPSAARAVGTVADPRPLLGTVKAESHDGRSPWPRLMSPRIAAARRTGTLLGRRRGPGRPNPFIGPGDAGKAPSALSSSARAFSRIRLSPLPRRILACTRDTSSQVGSHCFPRPFSSSLRFRASDERRTRRTIWGYVWEANLARLRCAGTNLNESRSHVCRILPWLGWAGLTGSSSTGSGRERAG